MILVPQLFSSSLVTEESPVWRVLFEMVKSVSLGHAAYCCWLPFHRAEGILRRRTSGVTAVLIVMESRVVVPSSTSR